MKIKLFQGFFVARPARFELTAFRLGGGRSILLSYGRIVKYYAIVERVCQILCGLL